ncbi:LOW QUALITY PROTEIN: kinesin-like protein KIF9 [Hemitrygon akajei]|uniref:LOW QUALITY PROTEIN: kinesin-like protein KIF9 n=1 Tax=Hemitrygon akajei TaxID=2704970 RepID=UPI003BF9AC26
MPAVVSFIWEARESSAPAPFPLRAEPPFTLHSLKRAGKLLAPWAGEFPEPPCDRRPLEGTRLLPTRLSLTSLYRRALRPPPINPGHSIPLPSEDDAQGLHRPQLAGPAEGGARPKVDPDFSGSGIWILTLRGAGHSFTIFTRLPASQEALTNKTWVEGTRAVSIAKSGEKPPSVISEGDERAYRGEMPHVLSKVSPGLSEDKSRLYVDVQFLVGPWLQPPSSPSSRTAASSLDPSPKSLAEPRHVLTWPCVSAKVQIRKRQQEQDIEAALQREYILIDKTSKASGLTADWVEHRISVESQVGDLSGEGFGTGLAPTSAKSKKFKKKKNKETTGSTKKEHAPVIGKDPEMIAQAKEPMPDVPAKAIAQREQDAANAESLSLSGSIVKAEEIGPSTPPQKAVMFEMFKAGKGREINRILIENRSILIERRKRMKELTERINNTKEEIDITKRSLNIKKRGREDEGEYMNEQDEPKVDEDEFNLIIQLKDLKQQYRQGFDVLQDLRVEVQYCQKLVVQCRLRLLTEFDIWYNESSLISSDTQLAPQMDNIRPGLVPYPTMISLEEDDKEKFQHIQHEILVLNPESVSFYKARMKLEQSHNYIKVVAQPQPITIKKKPGKITSTTKNKPPSNLQCH